MAMRTVESTTPGMARVKICDPSRLNMCHSTPRMAVTRACKASYDHAMHNTCQKNRIDAAISISQNLIFFMYFVTQNWRLTQH